MIEKLLSTTKAALIINEMQLGNFKMFPALGAEVERRGIVPKIAELAAAFRVKGLPVIHTPIWRTSSAIR
jgi:nicotinamidase-related amidase